MLAQTLGPGKAQVQVAAALNVNKTTQETLTYGKTGVPLQQSKDLETLTGSGGGTGAATGTANIPAYAQTGAGGKSNYKHEITNTSLGVEQDRHPLHRGPRGNRKPARLGAARPGPSPPPRCRRSAKPSPTPPGCSPSAATPSRSVRWRSPRPPSPSASPTSGIIGYAKYALIGLASLLFLFFTTRSLRKREQAGIDNEPVWLRELELPVRLSELERGTSAPAAAPPPAPAAMAMAGGDAPVRQRVEQLAESNPDRVAQQLRTWMQED